MTDRLEGRCSCGGDVSRYFTTPHEHRPSSLSVMVASRDLPKSYANPLERAPAPQAATYSSRGEIGETKRGSGAGSIDPGSGTRISVGSDPASIGSADQVPESRAERRITSPVGKIVRGSAGQKAGPGAHLEPWRNGKISRDEIVRCLGPDQRALIVPVERSWKPCIEVDAEHFDGRRPDHGVGVLAVIASAGGVGMSV